MEIFSIFFSFFQTRIVFLLKILEQIDEVWNVIVWCNTSKTFQ